jgi:peptide-methionine (R)-S-oxide reductase
MKHSTTKTRILKPFLILAVLVIGGFWLAFSTHSSAIAGVVLPKQVTSTTQFPITHTDAQWHKVLTPGQYYILREKGTETAGTGKYNDFWKKGTYVCAATGAPLFSSATKYDAHEGWPSFWAPISNNAVRLVTDHSLGMDRTEVVDALSGSHLGHLFTDGPKPTGLRYCIDSDALIFIPAGSKLPPVGKPVH